MKLNIVYINFVGISNGPDPDLNGPAQRPKTRKKKIMNYLTRKLDPFLMYRVRFGSGSRYYTGFWVLDQIKL